MTNEPTLSINAFNKPEVIKKEDADALRIYYIVMGKYDKHLTKDVCFDLRKYRFHEIISSKSKIETSLRVIIDKTAPDNFLDSISVNQVNDRTIHLIVKIIKTDSDDRNEIFFSIKKSKSDKFLVDLLK